MASTRSRVRDRVELPDVRPDLRVSFLGDSYVAGFGDAEHRGWVGRVAAWAHVIGFPVTVYNRSFDKTEAAVKRAEKEGENARRGGAGSLAAGAATTQMRRCTRRGTGQYAAAAVQRRWATAAPLRRRRARPTGTDRPALLCCRAGLGKLLTGYADVKDFVMSLKKPR